MNTQGLYLLGLLLVILYLLMGLDDFIWDIQALFRRRNYNKQLLDMKKLEETPPKLLAVMIACWHEDNVIGAVIENILASVQYPNSMYHIFLGLYPNDPETIAVGRELEKSFANVHVVINELPGPTSKAQNINYMIRQIKAFETRQQWRFQSFTVHDSEDVVHPYELKVTNYLIDHYPAIQFPVFPLMEMPRLRNFFKNMVTNTYADEFAENHFITMVSRYSSGAFVPSAGTGFALSRKTIERFGEDEILPENSLTEDYRLSLTLYEKGIQMYYVMLRVPRLTDDFKIRHEFIATRSRFPATFKTAIKQKARWITGITMQSVGLKEIFDCKMPIAGRYSLYRDQKAKIGNLLSLIGYPVVIYFLISLFTDLPPIYPVYSLSWYLSLLVTVMMIERELFRGISIYQVYGLRSVFFACLLPPVLPIRFICGNIINFSATVVAYFHRFRRRHKKEKVVKKETSKKAPKKIAWDKTDHQFLEKAVLKRYHRNLGDVLLEKGYISESDLSKALEKAHEKRRRLGNILIQENLLTEVQLLDALANVQQGLLVSQEQVLALVQTVPTTDFDRNHLELGRCVPLLKSEDHYVFAFSYASPDGTLAWLETHYKVTIQPVFTVEGTIDQAIKMLYDPNLKEHQATTVGLLFDCYQKQGITAEQLLLLQKYQEKGPLSEKELLLRSGLADV